MRFGLIGDIVGRPGRDMIKQILKDIKTKHKIDTIVANSENISNGFGATNKNINEMFNSGIDIFTGGNHSFDKKDDYKIVLQNKCVLRPANYPDEIDGRGVGIYDTHNKPFAVINLMGMFAMPVCDNPFRKALDIVDQLKKKDINTIIVDFHAETTSEKRVMMSLLKNKVSAIFGTHTHIGTDDLIVEDGTMYVTDVGLTGCRDNIIGMDSKTPIEKLLTGVGGHFKVQNNCKKIFQMVVVDINEQGIATTAKKFKIYDDNDIVITDFKAEI